ncbi:P-loop containing nucleoside triphosphate hydrolase protein [Mycena sp. CBHHK59/15]|nr:P-loop containing nucleoside triphosphate hydrolase protein [Mycena sp. CBHHK59/15]
MTDVSDSVSGGRLVVLILVGLIGSGKSTFAQALEDNFPEFSRCNQDDLGDRRKVEHLARTLLRNGSSVCIDRTNFDASQRAHWIKIAHEFPGTLIWVIVFDTPKDVCATRLRTRTEHPTIKNPEDAISILERFSSQYRAPSESEGYDRIIYLQPSDQETSYSRSRLAAILHCVRNAPSAAPSVGRTVYQPPTWRSRSSRGGSFRETRGRGDLNVHHTGVHRDVGSRSSSAVNRWGILSGQAERPTKFGTQTSKIQGQSEAVVISEPLVGGDSGAGSYPGGLPNDVVRES